MKRRRRDPWFARAAEERAAVRDEFRDVHENAYALAEHECNGVLLNAEGKRAGIDPFTLFIGTQQRAEKYASEELLEFWTRHPRVTVADYLEQRFAEEVSA